MKKNIYIDELIKKKQKQKQTYTRSSNVAKLMYIEFELMVFQHRQFPSTVFQRLVRWCQVGGTSSDIWSVDSPWTMAVARSPVPNRRNKLELPLWWLISVQKQSHYRYVVNLPPCRVPCPAVVFKRVMFLKKAFLFVHSRSLRDQQTKRRRHERQ